MSKINWESPRKYIGFIKESTKVGGILLVIGFLVYMVLWENRIEQKIDRIEQQSKPVIDSPIPESETPHPHGKHIETLESSTGLSLSRISDLIIKEEGVRAKPYTDSRGIVTIGIGRSLQTNGISITELFAIVDNPDLRYIMENASIANSRIRIDSIDVANQIFSDPLDEHDLDLLLVDDLKNVMMEARQVFGVEIWRSIDPVRQEAILDMLFNLGLPTFKTFENFIAAVKNRDWHTAANSVLLSRAARQNYNRYRHISHVLDTGDEKYFYMD
ncbi:MAG: hypothetical protein OXM61_16680 [Candidatus Poribacteria bacterium]|nr:hypothetical protein [Candidatus Poribacteria bacterium]